MRAPGRERERPARDEAQQPLLRIEQVEERDEVELVGAAAVQEDERAGGLAAAAGRARWTISARSGVMR